METVKIEVKTMLKYPFSKTLIQFAQAIENLTLQNSNGQYTERIAQLNSERIDAELWIRANTKPSAPIKVVHSEAEVRAIMGFNSDNRFTITE